MRHHGRGEDILGVLRLAPEPIPSARKDPPWLKRTGFDNIMTPEDLELDRPIQLGEGA